MTKKVLLFQEGLIDWRDIWVDLEGLVFDLAERALPDECTRADFADSLHARLLRMALRFKYNGKDFEALVNTTVSFQLRSFKSRLLQRRFCEERYIKLARPGCSTAPGKGQEKAASVPEPKPEYVNSGAVCFSGLTLEVRRSLLVAFHNAPFMDDSHLLALSRKFEVPFDWLFSVREEMKDTVFLKLEEMEQLKDNIQALQVCEIPAKVQQARDTNLPPQRRKHETVLRSRLSRLHVLPRHAELSDCLGIPRGSVSSTLHTIRWQKKEN